MNIVFWILLILLLVIVWSCLSFAYRAIGGLGLRIFGDVKKEFTEDEESERKEDTKNEG